ncbi:hypothetical protein C5167_043386 [Papaver somniferum]|uniref:Uncharacterized protein n=1 Tax=Papaver somniferum TaxID=3469 RepID=A0A4Y7L868_PAPSO|nr:hypothetical protein C5167_043386 [Papaver somniferum]
MKMATKSLLMCILVLSIAIQFCRADDDDLDKDNVNETFRAVDDTKNFIKKSISGATTDGILSSDSLISMFGIFINARIIP